MRTIRLSAAALVAVAAIAAVAAGLTAASASAAPALAHVYGTHSPVKATRITSDQIDSDGD